MPVISPVKRLSTYAAFVLTAGCIIAGCLGLPLDEYIAWQQAQGTQMFHAQWIHERIAFDETPVEVAIVGSSRVEAGVSPVELSHALESRLGRPVAVANLALVMPGRDFAAKVVARLVAAHPEVRLIILSDDGAVSNSHPMFFETASPYELLSAPIVLNTRYPANLLKLPYRNLMNRIESGFPQAFGKAARFDPAAYAGAGLDRTRGYRLADGTAVNGDLHATDDALSAFSAKAIAAQREGLARSRFLPEEWTLAIERRYTAQIERLCKERGIKLVFVRLPYFGPRQPVPGPVARERPGQVIALDGLSRTGAFYQDGAHLNRTGAVAASRALADAVAPLLEHEAGRADGVPSGRMHRGDLQSGISRHGEAVQ